MGCWRVAAAVAACAVCSSLCAGDVPLPDPPRRPLVVAGLVGGPGTGVHALSPVEVLHLRAYVPGSNVLRHRDGTLALGEGALGPPYVLLGAAPGAERAVRAGSARTAVAGDRAWLESGWVPGRDATERAMAERALLDLRMLQRPDGAVLAALRRHWSYAWPRDTSWVAVALARTGHPADALRALDWLAAVQGGDGQWAARYRPADGAPVLDGRPVQLDATGWVPWAVWSWVDSLGGVAALGGEDRAALRRLWPSVSAAADAAVASLDRRGLPRATRDWWELPVEDVTVSTAGALRAGLRGAADLARQQQAGAAAERWGGAAERLDAGIVRHYGRTGYRRTPDPDSGADAGAAAVAPPLAPYDPVVAAALADTQRRLAAPGGGLLPGEDFSGSRLSWTPAVGQLALAAAASGRTAQADRWLRWFAASRTSLGALPEKVDPAGRPAEVAPLAWTDALVLLTLVARDTLVPAPPVRGVGAARPAPGVARLVPSVAQAHGQAVRAPAAEEGRDGT